MIPLTVLILWLMSFKKESLIPQRRCLGWLFFGMLLPPLVVTILKSHNTEVCPWSLSIYGGHIPNLPKFSWVWSKSLAGNCFPGGHASTGFSLLAFYFAFRDTHARWAFWTLVFSLILGFGLGWVQVMRGAHFLSHNLWTAWVIWLVLFLFYYSYPPIKRQK